MVAQTSTLIAFYCTGEPQTQGSIRTFHRWREDGRCLVSSTHDNVRLKEWRALVSTAAKRAMKQRMPLTGPVEVVLTFWFRPPKTVKVGPWVFTRGRHDIDKTIRAVLDAMTDAAVWLDDGQVARVIAEKRYIGPGTGVDHGVAVAVTELTDG